MRGDVTDHPDEVSRALRERSDRTCLHALLDSAGVPRRATTPAPMGLGATPGPDGVVDIPVGERDLTEEERVLWLISERDRHRLKAGDSYVARQTEQQTPDLLTRVRAAAQVALDNGSHTAAAKLLELEARLTSPYLT